MTKSARGFPPVVDDKVTTLILGSFPSTASLAKGQYYGHPQNQFWRLVGAVIGEPLPDMDYEKRKRTLLKHHIGLWDVIGKCERAGSLDSNIRNALHNDFERVTGVAKHLHHVCFNGKTAAKMEPLFIEWGFESIVLPSSSPANTMRFEQKLIQWRQIVTPSVGVHFKAEKLIEPPRPPSTPRNAKNKIVGLLDGN
jgi:hypoxanthine-DNA glycosylase